MQVSRKQLVLSLKGQQVHIPDLFPISRNWPHGTNSEVHSIRRNVEERLERCEDRNSCLTCFAISNNSIIISLFLGDARLDKLKAADFSMFGSCWWPNAKLESLRIVTYLAIWVNLQFSQKYRLLIWSIIASCLGRWWVNRLLQEELTEWHI